MSANAWNDYAAEIADARDATPYGTRRVSGQVYDEADVPDEDEL